MRPPRPVDDLFVDQDERYPDIGQQPGSALGELDETGNASGRGDERAKKGKKSVAKAGAAVATDNTTTPADSNVVRLGPAQGLALASGRACTNATAFSLGLVNRWAPGHACRLFWLSGVSCPLLLAVLRQPC